MGALLAGRRRQILRAGRGLTLRRLTAVQAPRDVTLTGYPRLYRPDELAGGVQQGDQQVEILADEIAATGWPGPPQNGDRMVIDGHSSTVQGVRAVYEGTTLIGYSLWVRG